MTATSRLRQDAFSLQNNMEQSLGALRELQAHNERLINRVDELSDACSGMQREVVLLTNENADLKSRNSFLSNYVTELTTKLIGKGTELARLINVLNSIGREILGIVDETREKVGHREEEKEQDLNDPERNNVVLSEGQMVALNDAISPKDDGQPAPAFLTVHRGQQ